MDNTPHNRLAAETSPYLRQHADNPVDWYPWGDEAFAEARRRDLPVFLSVGYSACHWCHVMERETFADPELAAQLNQTFVCIKVDREERPDLDHLYMTACQVVTGSGGWPLTVLLTADRLPFHAGTYFPPHSQGGRLGVAELCQQVGHLWRTDRTRVLRIAGELERALRSSMDASEGDAATDKVLLPAAPDSDLPAMRLLETIPAQACRALETRFDNRWGGFGEAPKFPSPQILLLLLAEGWDERRQAPRQPWGEHFIEMARHTLLSMCRGGLRDHLGGGFHRYSTDRQWRIPHFEKMLYDQATLTLALVEGIQVSAALSAATGEHERDRLLDDTRELWLCLESTLDYVLKELKNESGVFRSAEDADSEGEEGRYYAWSWRELSSLLEPRELGLAAVAWGLTPEGNWLEEGGQRSLGRNVLCPARAPREAAEAAGLELPAFEQQVEAIRVRLLARRKARTRPAWDEKVLTDWNGLMIAALARAARAFGRDDWRHAAGVAAGFLLRAHVADGILMHRREANPGSSSGIPAMLDDHAFLIRGLLELACCGDSGQWLARAAELQADQDRLFWDERAQLYRMSASHAADLPMRPIEVRDGAMPCGNSISAGNLLRLGRLLGRPEPEDRALKLFGGLEARGALGGDQAMLLTALVEWRDGRELTLLAPDAARREPFLELLRSHYLPMTWVREEAGPIAQARLCAKRTCQPPVTTPQGLEVLLVDQVPIS